MKTLLFVLLPFVVIVVGLIFLAHHRMKHHRLPLVTLDPGHTAESRLPASVNNVPWDRAPIPPRWHTCQPQTKYYGRSASTSRCACGAWSRDGKTWNNRNSRKPGRHRAH